MNSPYRGSLVNLNSLKENRSSAQTAYIESHFDQTKQELFNQFESAQMSTERAGSASLKDVACLNKLCYSNLAKRQKLSSLKRQLKEFKYKESPVLASPNLSYYQKKIEGELEVTRTLEHILKREQSNQVIFT